MVPFLLSELLEIWGYKDELKRIHRDLIPYGKLDPAEKRKDIKNVQMFCDAREEQRTM